MSRKILTICFVVTLRIAAAASAQCGDPQAGDCCSANGTPDCADLACCEGVCQSDPFCCDSSWDEICAEEAQLICNICGGVCGLPAAGSCCEANPSAGCDDIACCADVCLIASDCCAFEWDDFCADLAAGLCLGMCCRPDLNGDAIVGPTDLSILVISWGPNPGHPADFNDDDEVDPTDLSILLIAWGPCGG